MSPIVTGIIGAFLLGGAYSFYQQKKNPLVVGILGVVGIALMVTAGVQFFLQS
ncbi:MAG: hypothetical protein ACTIJJ_09635 [Galactobacter sp.]|uniref:hypothetical protein n=1 Tax=Galactobacter sp. TaxID=2676125 RepID=UPI0025C0F2F9|nr:hypothetical protein [Galactobacter sp.]